MKSLKAVFLLVVIGLAVCDRTPNFNFWMANVHEPASCQLSDFMPYVPQGYPVEIHQVTTDDGFILQLVRVQKKGTTMTKGLHPILLQHGIDDSALSFAMNGEDKSAAFVLANEGFDVWLGNNRGNRFSREHVTLKQHQKEFWDWSFQQMAQYDIPAFIKKIREESGMDKISYIGHSQGTSQMFAALSDPVCRDSVAPYIDTFHAFAPVVYLTNTELMGFKLAKMFYWALNPALDLLNLNHMELGKCAFNEKLISKYEKECSKKKCHFYRNTDPDSSTINYEAYGYQANSHPAGFSMKCIVHYAQFIKEGRNNPVFKKFDYGSKAKNMAKYGQEHPPLYPLEDIKNRVVLYLGEEDRLADFKDSSRIAAKLTNAQVEVRDMSTWGHMAFVTPIDGDKFYSSIAVDIKQRVQKFTTQ